MKRSQLSRALYRLGQVLFVASMVGFFLLPGDAPSSRAKKDRRHSPMPVIFWIASIPAITAAFYFSERLNE